MWPSIFAFVISFVVIAAFWVGHYRTFRVVVRTDGRLIALNLAFLFCIAALPFPTSVLARHGDLAIAAILYAVFGVVTGALSTVAVALSGSGGARGADRDARDRSLRDVSSVVVPVVFALSIPLALVSPYAAEVLWVLMVPAQVIVSHRLGIQGALESSLRSS